MRERLAQLSPLPNKVPRVFQHYDAVPAGDKDYHMTHDNQTGLLNPLGSEIALSYLERKMPGGFAVLQLDLDELKLNNERHGHAAGDRLIKGVADGIRILRGTVRTQGQQTKSDRRRSRNRLPDAIGSREGGDEFLAILPGVEDQATAEIVEDRLQSELRREGISASSGSAQHEPGMAWREVVALADSRALLDKNRKRSETYGALSLPERVISRVGARMLDYVGGISPPDDYYIKR